MRRQKTNIQETGISRRARRLERKRAKEAKRYEEYLRDVQQLLELYKNKLLFDFETEQALYEEYQNQILRPIETDIEEVGGAAFPDVSAREKKRRKKKNKDEFENRRTIVM